MRRTLSVLLAPVLLGGCAGLPVREEVKEDQSLPGVIIWGGKRDGFALVFRRASPCGLPRRGGLKSAAGKALILHTGNCGITPRSALALHSGYQ